MDFDVIIVGTGLAGASTALSIDNDLKVALVTKKLFLDCNSRLAQGGICVCHGSTDRDAFINDTMKAGHYKNDEEAVSTMVDESNSAIDSLIDWGVSFSKKGSDDFDYTKEGGHSISRILHCQDETGRFIMEALEKEVRKRKNITLLENKTVLNLLLEKGKCVGVICEDNTALNADYVVLATGGIGGIYKNTTNFKHISGDGIVMAIKNNVELKDISYVQIHPTTLYEDIDDRRFLISESVRGEGALLYNHKNKRFVDELLPRDIVSKAIFDEMHKENVSYEFLSMKPIGAKRIPVRFPMIYSELKKRNINPIKEMIKIVPAHHYTMGGIKTNVNGETSLKGLYAVGEVANVGIHGENRLASNSLLESVVFGKRVGKYINEKTAENSASNQVSDKLSKNEQKILKNDADKSDVLIPKDDIIENRSNDFNKENDKALNIECEREIILRAIEEDKNAKKHCN